MAAGAWRTPADDADNTSPQIAGGLFEEIANFCEASVRASTGIFPVAS